MLKPVTGTISLWSQEILKKKQVPYRVQSVVDRYQRHRRVGKSYAKGTSLRRIALACFSYTYDWDVRQWTSFWQITWP